MQRRTLLQLPALAMLASAKTDASAVSQPSPRPVRDGADREGKARSVGVSKTLFKVATSDTNGALFVLEQSNDRKGGPSRHLHFDQDELFYVLEGDYVVEVGNERFKLSAGDCVLGPRGIPHVWAFAGKTTGRMVISFAPAGKMEAFFNDRAKMGIKPGEYASTARDAALLRSYGMELIGPPIAIDTL